MQHKTIAPATADLRGWIADVLHHTPLQHVALIESHAGVLRGNHYHRETRQWILVVRGMLKYWYQPVDGSEPAQSVIVGPCDLVETPPGEVHALEILAATVFLAFADGVRGGPDYESDTVRVPSIVPGRER